MLILIIVSVLCFLAAGVPVKIGNFVPRWEMWGVAAFIAALYLV